jgi:hypothetical protein
MKTPNLKEIYDSNIDVRESSIPEEWKKSFFDFMMGSTCLMEEKLDGSGENEFVYYSHDFRRWYYQNQIAIERSLKIDQIL